MTDITLADDSRCVANTRLGDDSRQFVTDATLGDPIDDI